MKNFNIIAYNQDCKIIFNVQSIHIDITDVQTIIYLPFYDSMFCENNTVRILSSIKSINIVSGTITVHYINDNYIIITKCLTYT